MDVMWFKKQQKKAGVTAAEIAKEAGRDRSVVSHIYTGRQRMSLDWAKAFAKVLEVPLDEVLRRAGTLDEVAAQTLQPGFSDSDATPWKGKPNDRDQHHMIAKQFGGNQAGVDVWIVRSRAMILGGYLPGDRILVDTNQSERCRAGDVVIAQKYDAQVGTATTVLRRYEPPVLVAASLDPEDQRALTVDWNNVVIRGKVIASWRDSRSPLTSDF